MSDLDIKGHLKITKQYTDGSQEIVLDDHNIIVSGMGLGLVYLFSLSGSTVVTDFTIDRYQIGTSGSPSLEVSQTFQLSAPLNSITEYTGNQGRVPAFRETLLTNNSVTTLSTFVKILPTQTSRVNDNTVRFSFNIDENSCNDLVEDINEVGLFMKNPTGFLTTNRSILVAYRYFNPITKDNGFSILFDWTITF